MLKKIFMEYFYFHKTERNGIIVLIIIICLLIITYHLLNLFRDTTIYDFKKTNDEITAFEKSLEKKNPATGYIQRKKSKKWYNVEKQKSYLPGYYHFEKKDSAKAYPGYFRKYKEENILVNINSADTSELIKIKGIGPVFALRIVKYRERIGGFTDKNQLMEIFGFDEDLLKQVSNHILIDTTVICKININSANIKELNKHPYLSFHHAKSIVEGRKISGQYKKTEDLIQYNIIPGDVYIKIRPYLIVELP